MTRPANIVIRIDDEVYGHLKERAEPFTDTPNTVLRRLLGLEIETSEELDDSDAPRTVSLANTKSNKARGTRRSRRKRRTAPRAPTGSILPSDEYVDPLLKALADAGGSASVRDVIGRVGESLNGRLTPTDLETLPSGVVRWQNRVQFVRLQLVQDGLMAKDSPRGVWTLTDAGRKRLQQSA